MVFELSTKDPLPLSVWQHHSGAEYVVISLGNLHSTNFEKFPVMVWYSNLQGPPRSWVRKLEDFHKSFKPTDRIMEDDEVIKALFPQTYAQSALRQPRNYVLLSYRHTLPSPKLEVFTSNAKEEAGEHWMHKLMENTQMQGEVPWEISLIVDGKPSDVQSPEELFLSSTTALSKVYREFAINMAAIMSIDDEPDEEWKDLLDPSIVIPPEDPLPTYPPET